MSDAGAGCQLPGQPIKIQFVKKNLARPGACPEASLLNTKFGISFFDILYDQYFDQTPSFPDFLFNMHARQK